ncbi:uncharacterized protein LOC125179518 [Hyalella azteca]|uniref:Uncharacterized protein LOC125179518 n=1 Tax=Hyalella azteca TaxID=294128 RepID=A0A979FW78_HYAAZ|nr:uncharacterized protein LOC125179518 [Hyalella azteca]
MTLTSHQSGSVMDRWISNHFQQLNQRSAEDARPNRRRLCALQRISGASSSRHNQEPQSIQHDSLNHFQASFSSDDTMHVDGGSLSTTALPYPTRLAGRDTPLNFVDIRIAALRVAGLFPERCVLDSDWPENDESVSVTDRISNRRQNLTNRSGAFEQSEDNLTNQTINETDSTVPQVRFGETANNSPNSSTSDHCNISWDDGMSPSGSPPSYINFVSDDSYSTIWPGDRNMVSNEPPPTVNVDSPHAEYQESSIDVELNEAQQNENVYGPSSDESSSEIPSFPFRPEPHESEDSHENSYYYGIFPQPVAPAPSPVGVEDNDSAFQDDAPTFEELQHAFENSRAIIEPTDEEVHINHSEETLAARRRAQNILLRPNYQYRPYPEANLEEGSGTTTSQPPCSVCYEIRDYAIHENCRHSICVACTMKHIRMRGDQVSCPECRRGPWHLWGASKEYLHHGSSAKKKLLDKEVTRRINLMLRMLDAHEMERATHFLGDVHANRRTWATQGWMLMRFDQYEASLAALQQSRGTDDTTAP